MLIFDSMKNAIFILALLITGFSFVAQETEITFVNGDFENALEEAREKNKLVYIDCQTSWCGPCKAMERDVFTNRDVASFYNEHFVSISLDMEKEGEAVKTEFEVSAYPTHLFVDADRRMIHRASGYQSSSQFVETGNNAIGKGQTKPNGQLQKAYEEGNRDPELLLEYHNFLVKFRLSSTQVFDDYLKAISPELLNSKEVTDLVMKHTKSTRSFAYTRMTSLSDGKNESSYSREYVLSRRKSVIERSAKNAISADDHDWILELIEECNKVDDPELRLRKVEIPYYIKTRKAQNVIRCVNRMSVILLGDSLHTGVGSDPERKKMLKTIQKEYKVKMLTINETGKTERFKINTLAEDYFKWHNYLNDPKNGLLLSNEQLEVTAEWLKIAWLIKRDDKYLSR